MNKLEQWFDEVVEQTNKIFTVPEGDFVIYKGFKITNTIDDEYLLQDVRYSNLYEKPSFNSYRHFLKYGFIEGCDRISHERDTKRVVSYTRRTEYLYTKRKRFKKLLSKDRPLNEKRIRNTNKKIDEYVDLIFFYRTRIEQFNIKYNDKKNENETRVAESIQESQ